MGGVPPSPPPPSVADLLKGALPTTAILLATASDGVFALHPLPLPTLPHLPLTTAQMVTKRQETGLTSTLE